MNLRDARYFIAAAQAPSFGRAAERCFLTQQALSAAIVRLERDLGERLFTRHRQGVELTDAGERLLPRAIALVELADATLAAVREPGAERSGSALRVGVMEPAAAELTTPIIQAFRCAHPETTVAVRELRFSGVTDALRSGQVDVAIGVGPLEGQSVRTTALFNEPRSLLLPRHHPLAEAEQLRVDDVLGLMFLPGSALPQEWIGFWRLEDLRNGEPARLASADVAEAHSPSEVNEVVAAEIAVITGPLSHRRTFPHPGVAVVPLADAPRSAVSAAVPARRASPLADAFVQTAASVSRTLIGLVDQARLE